MKIEFLVALMDHTWFTKVLDVPDERLPPEPKDKTLYDIGRVDEAAVEWANEQVGTLGNVALIAVYNHPNTEMGTCPSCNKEGQVGDGCSTCPGFWYE